MYLFCDRCNKYVPRDHAQDAHGERPLGASLVDNTPGIAYSDDLRYPANERVF